MDIDKTKAARRNAPRVSPRPRRTLRHARKAARMSVQMKNIPTTFPVSPDGGAILSGFDQGPITWKYTGLPRQDAASIRSGAAGACPYDPVHAARASKLTKGIHCGSAGTKRLMSTPAAANNAVQSAGCCGTDESSI